MRFTHLGKQRKYICVAIRYDLHSLEMPMYSTPIDMIRIAAGAVSIRLLFARQLRAPVDFAVRVEGGIKGAVRAMRNRRLSYQPCDSAGCHLANDIGRRWRSGRPACPVYLESR